VSKVGQPNTNKKSFMTMLLPVIAVMLLSTAALNFIMVSRSNEQHVVQMSNQIANSRADALNAVVGQLRSQQESFGKSPDVIRVLEDNDIAAIESFGDNYLMSFDSAERAYLIPVGAAQEFDLKFAEIDMVSKVEQAQVVPPEAYQIGGKKLVSMATLVSNPASKTNLGTLLVTYTLKPFQTALRQNRDDGQVILQQAFPGSQPLEIVSNGTAGTAEPVSADTLVPNWKIVFKPSDKFSGSKISSARDIALIQGIAIILCAVLLGVFQWRRSHGIAASDSILETPIQIKGARKIDKSDKIDISAPPPSVELADPLFNNTDILDLDDDEEFDIRPSSSAPTVVNRPVTTSAPPPPPAKKEKFVVPATAFRDYDIRGHADKDLTDDIARRIGRAFGSECQAQGQAEIVLAGDGRLSTPRLKAAVQEGLLESGCNVLDIGEVPTPLMYFATQTTMSRSGIMVTASHNGASDNGFKMVINGKTLSGDDIQKIKERIENNEYTTGAGSVEQRDMVSTYIDHIVGDVALAGSYRVVVDCGNGVAGSVAPKLFEELGCEVIPLYCEVDGRFPNHAPDPSAPGSLDDLVARVQADGADLGIALDGDGDRITVVTSSGKIVLPDVLLMLFAKDIVSRNPGTDVIFDVKSTKRLNSLVSSYGGRPVMWKSGHSHIKNKMQETGALIAGELSGHIFIRERWFGFDDGMYAGARLLEIMSIRDQDLDGIFSAFPETSSTPEMRIPIDETQKFSVIRQLSEKGEWGNGKVSKIDGVRVDFAKGWGLVRASNTAAELTLRFEADDDDTLATVQHLFKQQLAMVDKSLKLPF
jgi:phosphomannomutase/phosphoglucomutase